MEQFDEIDLNELKPEPLPAELLRGLINDPKLDKAQQAGFRQQLNQLYVSGDVNHHQDDMFIYLSDYFFLKVSSAKEYIKEYDYVDTLNVYMSMYPGTNKQRVANLLAWLINAKPNPDASTLLATLPQAQMRNLNNRPIEMRYAEIHSERERLGYHYLELENDPERVIFDPKKIGLYFAHWRDGIVNVETFILRGLQGEFAKVMKQVPFLERTLKMAFFELAVKNKDIFKPKVNNEETLKLLQNSEFDIVQSSKDDMAYAEIFQFLFDVYCASEKLPSILSQQSQKDLTCFTQVFRLLGTPDDLLDILLSPAVLGMDKEFLQNLYTLIIRFDRDNFSKILDRIFDSYVPIANSVLLKEQGLDLLAHLAKTFYPDFPVWPEKEKKTADIPQALNQEKDLAQDGPPLKMQKEVVAIPNNLFDILYAIYSPGEHVAELISLKERDPERFSYNLAREVANFINTLKDPNFRRLEIIARATFYTSLFSCDEMQAQQKNIVNYEQQINEAVKNLNRVHYKGLFVDDQVPFVQSSIKPISSSNMAQAHQKRFFDNDEEKSLVTMNEKKDKGAAEFFEMAKKDVFGFFDKVGAALKSPTPTKATVIREMEGKKPTLSSSSSLQPKK